MTENQTPEPLTFEETKIRLKVELPTSSELFQKHFSMAQANMSHPNMEAFFEELNMICQIEDSIKTINQSANGE